MEEAGSVKLADLVDFSDVQRMMAAHYKATGMPSGIIDTRDGSVMAGAGWQDICTRFHRVNPISAKRCTESDLDIDRHIKDGQPYAYKKCLNGLWDIGIPITVSGRHLATFFLGQFLYEGEYTDQSFFERQADEFGFDKKAYMEALARVPVFSREKVADILEYNQALASFIGKLAESNLIIREQLLLTQSAQGELAEQKAFMQALFETIPIPIFTKSSDLIFTSCNAAFERMIGLPRADIIGNTVYVFAPKALADIYTAMDRELLQSGDKQVYQSQVSPPGGGLYDIEFHKALLKDASGTPTGFVGLAFDITDRLHAEKELEKSRNLIKDILDSAPSAIIGVDENGIVNHWNVSAQRLFGSRADSVTGKPLAQALPFMASHADKLAEALKNRRIEAIERMSLLCGQDTRLVDIQFYPLATEEIHGAVIRIDDVTERERLREMMVQTEKMMSVGGLAAGMAHEINNPLGAILQSAQLIESRFSSEREQNKAAALKAGCDILSVHKYLEERQILEFLKNIREAGHRASEIVSNMIDFSRKSDTSKDYIDLSSVLDKSVALASSDYDLKKKYDFKYIHIIKEYSPDVPPVYCSRTEIEQVLLNLLKNAAQAMSLKKYENGQPTITLRLHTHAGNAIIEVEDNGPGIDPVMCKKVFEPFYTSKRPGEGTGLGLSVSYFIVVNNHGGDIRVSSSTGKGARFVIELPLKAGPGAQERENACPGQPVSP